LFVLVFFLTRRNASQLGEGKEAKKEGQEKRLGLHH